MKSDGLPSCPFDDNIAARHLWVTAFARIQNTNIRLKVHPEVELWGLTKSLKATDRFWDVIYGGYWVCYKNSCRWQREKNGRPTDSIKAISMEFLVSSDWVILGDATNMSIGGTIYRLIKKRNFGSRHDNLKKWVVYRIGLQVRYTVGATDVQILVTFGRESGQRR